MKLTLALLLCNLVGMRVAEESNKKKDRMSIIKEAYYSNLFQFTLDLSRKVFETRIELVRY
jgi:hypothetical protein